VFAKKNTGCISYYDSKMYYLYLGFSSFMHVNLLFKLTIDNYPAATREVSSSFKNDLSQEQINPLHYVFLKKLSASLSETRAT
jgi:hypothetical protein